MMKGGRLQAAASAPDSGIMALLGSWGPVWRIYVEGLLFQVGPQ